jgi:uncharacterized protein (TIGR02246 family)
MSPQMQGTPQDEQAIRTMSAEFMIAWNKNDSKALAACFTADGDLINPLGQVGRGRNEVQKIFTEGHSGPFKGSRLSMQQKHLRFLKPDIAVTDYEFEISGMRDPSGKQTTQKGLVTGVLRKEGEKWLFAASRPSIPVPPPANL